MTQQVASVRLESAVSEALRDQADRLGLTLSGLLRLVATAATVQWAGGRVCWHCLSYFDANVQVALLGCDCP